MHGARESVLGEETRVSDSPDRDLRGKTRERGYLLAPGTQVREEDFGLLFYTMYGPRLFFFPCGKILDSRFFDGETTLKERLESLCEQGPSLGVRVADIEKGLEELKGKGIILER